MQKSGVTVLLDVYIRLCIACINQFLQINAYSPKMEDNVNGATWH